MNTHFLVYPKKWLLKVMINCTEIIKMLYYNILMIIIPTDILLFTTIEP